MGTTLDPRVRDRHVALIGLMGVGKSTIGQLVADRLGRSLWDNDRVIAERYHQDVRALAEAKGTEAMHALEDEVLRLQLGLEEPAVLPLAGSAILTAANRDLLAARAVTVWLSADPARLARRIRASAQARPFVDDDLEATLTQQLAERRALYAAAADLVVEVDDEPPARVADAVVDGLRALPRA